MGDSRTDDELLRAEDPESFAVFYRRHVDWVLAFLVHRTRDPELAADLAGEVFAAALLARERYRPRDGRANSWLFKIALNKLIDAQRRGVAEDRARRRLGMRRVVPDSDDLRHIEALGDDVNVLALLENLPGDQRRAITARVLEERDYGDIAVEEQVPETVLRKRVSRGLSTLRSPDRGPNMNDFTSRLEKELLEAAGRRRWPRRRLAARLAPSARRAAVAVATIALVMVVVAVIPRPRDVERSARPRPGATTGPVPRELVGSYVGHGASGGVTLILDTRRYTLLLAGQPALTGDASLRGGPELVLGNDGGGPCGIADRPAVYRVAARGARLRLRRVEDFCPARAQALRAPLARGG